MHREDIFWTMRDRRFSRALLVNGWISRRNVLSGGVLLVLIVGAATWWVWTTLACPGFAEVRVPDPLRPAPENWMGIPDRVGQPRIVAEITGCFRPHRTGVLAEIFSVADGFVASIGSGSASRGASQRGLPAREMLNLRCGLIDVTFDEQPAIILRFNGTPNSGWGGGINPAPFAAVTHQTFACRIPSGEKRLVYVEGDRDSSARAEMTPEQFATENPKGRFLLVELKWIGDTRRFRQPKY